MEPLRAAIDLPASANVESLAVHDEDAGRAFSPVGAGAAQGADIQSLGTAVDGVRTRIAGLSLNLLRLDDLDDLRPRRVRLGVDDIDPRGADAGDDEIPALEEGMARERR